MPFVTSVERIGMEKGLKKGRIDTYLEAIAMDVEATFPHDAAELMTEVRGLNDVENLRAALRAIKNIQTPAEFRTVLAGFANINRSI